MYSCKMSLNGWIRFTEICGCMCVCVCGGGGGGGEGGGEEIIRRTETEQQQSL